MRFYHEQRLVSNEHFNLIQPENLMLFEKDYDDIKLIDFGMARKFNPHDTMKVLFGTPEFVGRMV